MSTNAQIVSPSEGNSLMGLGTFMVIGSIFGTLIVMLVYKKQIPSAKGNPFGEKEAGIAVGVLFIIMILGGIFIYLGTQQIPIMGRLPPVDASTTVIDVPSMNKKASTLKKVGSLNDSLTDLEGTITDYVTGGETATTAPPVSNKGDYTFNEVKFEPIGHGPLMVQSAARKWIQSIGAKTVDYVDPNNDIVELPEDRYRAITGFVPPSFQFFPFGQTNNDYNTSNYESGRKKCMEACALTECAAVLTEVPQNCAHQTIQLTIPSGDGDIPLPGQYVNGCGSEPTHSCTLFYDNINKADQAYWKIDQNKCLDTTGDVTNCLGQKYFVNEIVPELSPYKNEDPTTAKIKWCPSKTVRREADATKDYVRHPDATQACTCTTGACEDTNCCKFRPILTTESARANTPYYHLPTTFTDYTDGTYTGKAPDIEAVQGTNHGRLCGKTSVHDWKCWTQKIESGAASRFSSEAEMTAMCPPIETYKSCPAKKCTSERDRYCWKVVRTEANLFDKLTGYAPPGCKGEIFHKDQIAQEAFDAYKSSGNQSDITPLQNSCYWAQSSTMSTYVQPACKSWADSQSKYGCFGTPQILNVDSIDGEAYACSDNRIAPQNIRCSTKGHLGLGKCVGFPYACGTQNGTNQLWKRQAVKKE